MAACSERAKASLVKVAPEIRFTFALCACRTSVRSSGTAWELMNCERGRSTGYCKALTSVIFPPCTLIATCTGPYSISTVGPVNTPLTLLVAGVGGVEPPEGVEVVPPGEDTCTGVEERWIFCWWWSTSTRTATTTTTATALAASFLRINSSSVGNGENRLDIRVRQGASAR